jgi:hypothetical protein
MFGLWSHDHFLVFDPLFGIFAVLVQLDKTTMPEAIDQDV